ncbi:hypothetical protein GCM10011356_16000 [Kangiella profundi]|nr:hypothetical protein GCM10011356_16000 [Kangiella profundi]
MGNYVNKIILNTNTSKGSQGIKGREAEYQPKFDHFSNIIVNSVLYQRTLWHESIYTISKQH